MKEMINRGRPRIYITQPAVAFLRDALIKPRADELLQVMHLRFLRLLARGPEILNVFSRSLCLSIELSPSLSFRGWIITFVSIIQLPWCTALVFFSNAPTAT